MNRIIKFVMLDIVKNKIVLTYAILLAVLSWSVFSLEDNSAKGLLTLLNVMLLTVPLVSIIFSTIYIYNSSEFIELLVSQPIKRSKIWISLFLGLCLALITAFFVGVGIPLLIYAPLNIGLIFILTGFLITIIFIAIAFLSAVIARDKAKGIGMAIMLWLFFTLLFDGLVLFLLFQLAEYPIEQAMVLITMLSPVDIARILILLQLDISALLGYTGAIFKAFYGSENGIIITFIILLIWAAIPFWISLKKFNNKDL
ncbi:MAG: ABC transporter permease subunit [Bacteroidia bacterium]|nr:ABC transporter permease subunit [Bacteroidia bacterium]